MAALIECDNCKKTTPEHSAYGWRSVEVIEETPVKGIDETVKTFCSWKCVAAVAWDAVLRESKMEGGDESTG